MYAKTTALTLMTMAGVAAAQPAVFTDLGNHTTTQTFTQNVTLTSPSDIQWFRITLPGVAAAAGFVDIWTTPTADPAPATDMTDTEIGLYDNLGNAASTGYNDDDDGPANYSALSYGSTTSRGATTYGTLTVGAVRNGRDGPLAGGVYWLAVGRFNVTFAPAAFGAVGTYTGTQTTALLNFDIQAATDPYPPTATGAASSSSSSAGDTVLYTVTVVPGGNPASSGVTVTGDLTAIGGSATAAFNDSGTGGDATAGDNIYSLQYTFPTIAADANYSIPVTVTDAQSRTATTTISGAQLRAVTWNESTNGAGDAGQTIATAQTPAGTGTALNVITGSFDASDVDIYKISICNEAAFSATTRFTSPLIDTQLFLFNPDGTGVVVDDDVPVGSPGDDTTASTISSAMISANGDYYLAISRYNIDPVDSANALIWANTPFDTERAPDGPGAANPLSSWTGVNATTGDYRITFTGACFSGGTGPVCGPADVGGQGGVQGADGHLDNNDFVVFIDLFFNHSPIADVGSQGGVAGADGAWDNNDFIVFIDQFFNAPASCR